MKSSGSNPTPIHSQATLVACPHCGQYTARKEITFQRGSSVNKVRLSAWIAPFIKTPPIRGQVCEYCRQMFNVTRSPMPGLYYAWLFLLLSIGTGSAVLLYLLLFGP